VKNHCSKAMKVLGERSKPQAMKALNKWGVLLLQDPALPSLVGLIVGKPLKGSWWSHPKGSDIFNAAEALTDHPDVASIKLISGKVTFVHRRLWPKIIAIGKSREPWQMAKLRKEARALLARVDKHPRLRASGNQARVLQQRLLVASQEVHTESGKHAMELMTWRVFARERKVKLSKLSVTHAKKDIQALVEKLNTRFGGKGKLPF